LCAHPFKAVMGVIPTLILNDDARKRHGKSLLEQFDRIDGVRLIAEAPHEWMSMRNACLYAEADLRAGKAIAPCDRITREHAYIMLVAALEVLAKFYSPYFTYHRITADQRRDTAHHQQVIEEIERFMEREAGKVELDRLDFIGDRARVQGLKKAVR